MDGWIRWLIGGRECKVVCFMLIIIVTVFVIDYLIDFLVAEISVKIITKRNETKRNC